MLRKTLLSLTAATMISAAPVFAQDADIVDTAVAAGSFTTLVAAVEAAGLVETLKAKARSPSSRPRTRPLPRCPKARSTRFWPTRPLSPRS